MNKAALKGVAMTTLFFGFWGPLVGGLPYVWAVITIPFAYAFGLGPALICGLLYGLWRWRSPLEGVGAWWRAGRGALCGLIGCVVCGLAYSRSLWDLWPVGILALHGVPAGAILGAWRRAAPAVEEPSAQMPGPVPNAW